MRAAVSDVGCRALRARIDESGRSAPRRNRATAIPAASIPRFAHRSAALIVDSARSAALRAHATAIPAAPSRQRCDRRVELLQEIDNLPV
jgi:hypothetical protein